MTELGLEPAVVSVLQTQLPRVAAQTIAAVVAEVPEYTSGFAGEMGSTIEGAVQAALAGFLHVAAQGGAPTGPFRDGAYALGRGEARSGRTMDALLAAYRVGARVAWREMAATAVDSGVPSSTVARFAELVFAYIDQLSAASAAGHTDELATSGRVREQYRARLAEALLSGASPETLATAAQRAEWTPPATLTAVLLPSARSRDTAARLDPRTLALPGDVVGLEGQSTVLLVPDADRGPLLGLLRGAVAVVGPARPWTSASSSYRRAARALDLALPGLVDTDAHLPALVLGADPEALADLRARALAPLADLRPGSAARLAETLRSWLLHQGRREDVAAHLLVHPQTVRYRMTQLRELYGDRLADPDQVLELTLALAVLPDA